MKKRKIYFLSVGRSDFHRLKPIIENLDKKYVEYKILISGSHYKAEFGYTYREIVNYTSKYIKAVKNYSLKDNAISYNIVNSLSILSKIILKDLPDILVILGDRYEIISGALSTLGSKTIIAHVHGGAVTKGAIDDVVRHSATKLSNLHFASSKIYGDRIIRMGENKKYVRVVGAPGLDMLRKIKKISRKEFYSKTTICLEEKYFLCCFHPVTRDLSSTKKYVQNLLNAIKDIKIQCIITYPNSDPGSQLIINEITKFKSERKNSNKVIILKRAEENIFHNLIKNSNFIIGNSSIGIVEAGFLKIPVINIGNRQIGKLFSKNIIQSGYSVSSIKKSITKLKNKKFLNDLKNVKSPYGNGTAGPKIAKILTNIKIDDNIIKKVFVD